MDLTSESVKEFLFNFDFVPLVGVNMSSSVDFKQNLFRN